MLIGLVVSFFVLDSGLDRATLLVFAAFDERVQMILFYNLVAFIILEFLFVDTGVSHHLVMSVDPLAQYIGDSAVRTVEDQSAHRKGDERTLNALVTHLAEREAGVLRSFVFNALSIAVNFD